MQTRWSESSSSDGATHTQTHTHSHTHNSFNGITGNSVPPQCFNVLLDTLTHRSLQEEIRNQYVLPIGLPGEAGRGRDRRGDTHRQKHQIADLHLISSLHRLSFFFFFFLQHPSESIKHNLSLSNIPLTLLPPRFSRMPPSDWQQFKPVKTNQGTGGLSTSSPSRR